MNPDQYPVYPEDDGHDRFRNPYTPVLKPANLLQKKRNDASAALVGLLMVRGLTAVMATMQATAETGGHQVEVMAEVMAEAVVKAYIVKPHIPAT